MIDWLYALVNTVPRALTPAERDYERWLYGEYRPPYSWPHCSRCMYSALVCKTDCYKKTKPLYCDDPGIYKR